MQHTYTHDAHTQCTHTGLTHGAHTRCSHTRCTHTVLTHTRGSHTVPQSGKHWKHRLRKLKSSSEKMTPRTARPLQRMRCHRTPGHTVPAGHWRGKQRSQVGFGSHGIPRPQREEQSVSWGSPRRGRPGPAREGVRKGGRQSPGPQRCHALRPRRPPGIHGTPQPGLGGACSCCTARALQSHPPRCREKQTHATPARPHRPRPAEPRTSQDRKGPRVTFCRRQDPPPPSRVHAV